MKPEWVKQIRDQCFRAGVPFFFKKWGGRRKDVNGRVFDGKEWNEMPEPVWQPLQVLEDRTFT